MFMALFLFPIVCKRVAGIGTIRINWIFGYHNIATIEYIDFDDFTISTVIYYSGDLLSYGE